MELENKYFIVTASNDEKIIGKLNGGLQSEIQKNGFKNKKYYDNYIEKIVLQTGKSRKEADCFFGDIPNVDFELEYVALEKRAILTDFLTYYPTFPGGAYFLISEKVFNIIRDFNLPKHKYYCASIFKNKKNITDYRLLYIPVFLFNNINLCSSFFFTGSELLGKEYLKIETEDSFYEARETYGLIIPEQLSLNKNLLDKNYDLFNVLTANYLFISERLKMAFEENKITGISYRVPGNPLGPSIIFE